MRRIALLSCLAVLAAAALSSAAKAQPADDACASSAPSAAICIGAQKPAEAAATTCRVNGGPEEACAASPVGHVVRPSDLAAYRGSWVHRAAQFQYALGASVPLRDAQWLGTHNSFNTDANGVTLSHTDNNQQLTLTEQLDGDVRALELDVHYINGSVLVCHGRGADELHAGCTTEAKLTDVLPEIATWLDAHRDQVLLLYIEDELGDDAGYPQTVAALDAALGTKIYRPAAPAGANCTNLPLDRSRQDVLDAGAQVVLVGNCRAGWASRVFGWDDVHVESGSTPDYAAFPGCDATYDRGVYAAKLVRYYEDSTWVSAAIDPAQTPAEHAADGLSPEKVAAMTACGVNLFGFDQFVPTDGRVEASIWSWAPGEPGPTADLCATQRPTDGRWSAGSCGGTRPAACRTANGFALSPKVAREGAPGACHAVGGTFAPPRTGEENAQLRAAAAGASPWLAPA